MRLKQKQFGNGFKSILEEHVKKMEIGENELDLCPRLILSQRQRVKVKDV